VCVIDTGIQFDHPDLAANMPQQLVYDAVQNTRASADNDEDGHGTHVAGMVVVPVRLTRACIRRSVAAGVIVIVNYTSSTDQPRNSQFTYVYVHAYCTASRMHASLQRTCLEPQARLVPWVTTTSA
jgi:hypothetical protein